MDLRVDVFASNSNFWQFVALPAIFAIFGGIAAPWITLGGAWVAKWPAELLKKLQMNEARKLRIHDFNAAAEELEAEAEFNIKKVEVAESLKRAEEVGGEVLLESIKAGPSGSRAEEKSAQTSEDDAFETSVGTSVEVPESTSAQQPEYSSVKVMKFFDDNWSFELPRFISKIPESSSGQIAVIRVSKRTVAQFVWSLRFMNGYSVSFGESRRESKTPEELEQLIAVGVLSMVDNNSVRISSDLERYQAAATDWQAKNSKV